MQLPKFSFTIQSVVFTDDVFQFFLNPLPCGEIRYVLPRNAAAILSCRPRRAFMCSAAQVYRQQWYHVLSFFPTRLSPALLCSFAVVLIVPCFAVPFFL